METPISTLLRFFISFMLILHITTQADSALMHDDYLKCLESRTSNSISEIIYTPETSSYISTLLSTAQNLRAESSSPLKPAFILTPLCDSQIPPAIYCAKRHGLQIRVRSGGHDYEGLSYISDVPFVVVDLRNLNSIRIDKESSTAWIQAGATLGELYHKVAEESRTLGYVAGVCPTVGVGGHFSGGGYSMMSRKFGIAADHIIDAKIIDAEGRILDRKSMGENLFWAIRGGGGASFGVIVAWKVELLTVPETVTVFNVTKTLGENATELVYRWQYIADKIDENLLIRLFLSKGNSPGKGKRTVYASFTSLFLGGADDLLSMMHHIFPELGLVKEDCNEMSWIDSVLYFAQFSSGESVHVLLNRRQSERGYVKVKSDYVTQPISKNGLNGIWEMLLEVDDGIAAELQFSPLGGRFKDISESAIPFPHRAGNIYMILYAISWDEGRNAGSRRYVNWMRRLHSYMATYVSKSPRAAYLNYRDLDLGVNSQGNTSYISASIWGTKYFKNNFNRLVLVKTQVDPSNFFRNEQSIPVLLSNAVEQKIV